MFGNFGSKDFAKVLLVEELSDSSVLEIVRGMMREGVEIGVVTDFINIQRSILGLEKMGHESYLDIFEDDLLVNSRKYYGKCEELKIVLVLYLVEYREMIRDGNREVNMFGLYRVLRSIGKYLSRIKGVEYRFDRYEDLVREMM